jgi:hypothetical protein
MFYVSIDIFNQMFLRFPSAHKERDLQVLRLSHSDPGEQFLLHGRVYLVCDARRSPIRLFLVRGPVCDRADYVYRVDLGFIFENPDVRQRTAI